jgi:hypothetical protein
MGAFPERILTYRGKTSFGGATEVPICRGVFT